MMRKNFYFFLTIILVNIVCGQVKYFDSGKDGLGLNISFANSIQSSSGDPSKDISSMTVGFQGGYCFSGVFGLGLIISRPSDQAAIYYGGFLEGALLKTKYAGINVSSSFQTGTSNVEYYVFQQYGSSGFSIQSVQERVRIDLISATCELNVNIVPIDYDLEKDKGIGIFIASSYLHNKLYFFGTRAEERVALTAGADLKMYFGRLTVILTPSYSAVFDPRRLSIYGFGLTIADSFKK